MVPSLVANLVHLLLTDPVLKQVDCIVLPLVSFTAITMRPISMLLESLLARLVDTLPTERPPNSLLYGLL